VNKTYLPSIERAAKKKAEHELLYYTNLQEAFNPNSRTLKPEFRGERALVMEKQRIQPSVGNDMHRLKTHFAKDGNLANTEPLDRDMLHNPPFRPKVIKEKWMAQTDFQKSHARDQPFPNQRSLLSTNDPYIDGAQALGNSETEHAKSQKLTRE